MPLQLLAAMTSSTPSGLGGMQALPSHGGAMPIGAGALLPAGMQPGLSGGAYQLQPYGFTPAPATGAVGAKPFVPGQSLQNQAKAPVMPASWSPEMKQRFILLQRLLGDRRELDPALFAARWGWPQPMGGGFEGKGPAAPGSGSYGSANAGIGGAYGSTADRDSAYGGAWK
jgi:hypothetical protein